MKSIILYSSRHHGNTRRLVQAVAEQYPVDLLDGDRADRVDLEDYDLIGFASGIDFGKFYPRVTELAGTLPEGKLVYAMYTCARDNEKYGHEIRQIAKQRGCVCLGKYGCRGYNTYGPWKLIGGMNKAHPSPEEMAEAVRFYGELLSKVRRISG